MPKSTLINWKNEFNKWCPTLNVVVLIGDEKERNQIIKNAIMTKDFDAGITSYEMTLECSIELKDFTWEYIVMDGALQIKNVNSKITSLYFTMLSILLACLVVRNDSHGQVQESIAVDRNVYSKQFA